MSMPRKQRVDSSQGDPIWVKVWEKFTDQVKGKRAMKRKKVGVNRVVIDGIVTFQPIYDEHPAGQQVLTAEQISAACQDWPVWRQWVNDNPIKARALGGRPSANKLSKERPYWVIKSLDHKWGACDVHTGGRYRASGLTASRRLLHEGCECECVHCQDHAAYFSSTAHCTDMLSTILCPAPCNGSLAKVEFNRKASQAKEMAVDVAQCAAKVAEEAVSTCESECERALAAGSAQTRSRSQTLHIGSELDEVEVNSLCAATALAAAASVAATGAAAASSAAGSVSKFTTDDASASIQAVSHLRALACCIGKCDSCGDWESAFPECPLESGNEDFTVTYKRSEPVKVKESWDSQKEWREHTEPYPEFIESTRQ